MNELFEAAAKINQAQATLGELWNGSPAGRTPAIRDAIQLLDRAMLKIKGEANHRAAAQAFAHAMNHAEPRR
jgi:hypothetical protein